MTELESMLAGHVARRAAPGAVALVSCRSEPEVAVVGSMALGGAPMRRDTIFRISSMTKPITAVASLLLVDEGHLKLDDPVDRHLPELADRRVLTRMDGPLEDTVPAERPIRVHDLLAFTMGMGIAFGGPMAGSQGALELGQGPPAPAALPPPDEWIRRLGTLPLMAQPGSQWLYNTGSDVLGVLVARVAGESFDRVLHQRIFEPLGMVDTGFSVPARSLHRLVTATWGDGNLYDSPGDGQWRRPPAFPSGAAGLVSTVDDYLLFAQALLDGQLLSASSLAAMTSDQLTPRQRAIGALVPGYFNDHSWGFGVSMVTDSGPDPRPVGSYGWNGGMGTEWWNDPSSGTVAILMTQQAWSSPTPPTIVDDFRGFVSR